MIEIANPFDRTYAQGMQELLTLAKSGVAPRVGRTAERTFNTFGSLQVYDASSFLPILSKKMVGIKAVISELIWFISGSGNERDLAEILYGTRDPSKQTIWSDNANAPYWKPKARAEGDLGRVYGVQWRSWHSPNGNVIDQLDNLIQGLKRDPYGRRHIVSAWNPGELDQMALPPCHNMMQFFVTQDGKLDCQMYQRSADYFLGVPFNITSYATLLLMVAQVTKLKPGRFLHVIGDKHLYENHISAAEDYMSRIDHSPTRLLINPEVRHLDDFKMSDFTLEDYKHSGRIPAPMAV